MIDIEAQTLSSTTGVVTVTLVLIEVLKRFCGQRKAFKTVPVWVYASLIAVGLGLLANKVIIVEGVAMMPGHALTVVWRCVVAAAASSGFYSWLHNPETLKTASEETKT